MEKVYYGLRVKESAVGENLIQLQRKEILSFNGLLVATY